MQRLHDIVQTILTILSNPAWSGIGSTCSFIAIPLSVFLARKSHTRSPHLSSYLKKSVILPRIVWLFPLSVSQNKYSLLKNGEANLNGAKVTLEQLAKAKLLTGTIMPDWSKHP